MIWAAFIAAIIGLIFWSMTSKVWRSVTHGQAAADPEGYRAAIQLKEGQKPENKAKAEAILEKQRREARALMNAPLNPIDDAPIVIKSGETAYWVEHCRYYEERSLRDIGLDRGMLEVDSGPLILTDKRIVFAGSKRTIEIPLTKVVAIQQLDGAMNVNIANAKSRRLGTGNPRAKIVATRLLAGKISETRIDTSRSPSKQAAETPVYMNLSQSFNGPQGLIVQTLRNLATVLQAEVDRRSKEYAYETMATAVDTSTYLSTITAQFARMEQMFARAEKMFTAAASTKGSPEMLKDAYAEVLDQILGVRQTLQSVAAPPCCYKLEVAYEEFIESFYRQISNWPRCIQQACVEVHGDHHDLKLTAMHDIAPLERALFLI